MNKNIGESMELKLNEAKFFYESMKESEEGNNILHYRYYFSAFLSALRSVLQYAWKYDERKYQRLIKNLKYYKYFKEVRDVNIHEKPTAVSKIGLTELPTTIIKVKLKKEAYNLSIEEAKNIPIEELIVSVECEKSNEPAVHKKHFIAENQLDHEDFMDHSLTDICKWYIDEVNQFMKEFLN